MSIYRFIFVFLALLGFGVKAGAQGVIAGRVTGASDGLALAGATVILDGTRGTATDGSGRFLLDRAAPGRHTLEVRLIGYEARRERIEVTGRDTVHLNFVLTEMLYEAGEVVVTANRGVSRIADVPSRVTLISARAIESRPVTSVDEILATVPGLNISRSFGIFSHKSSVTMRGLSGNEQARVLVMIDGVPVNKSDGGSVNWNLLDPAMVERIEVVKGPASTMYGSNAMGGAINVITRRPQGGGFSGKVSAGYGTYNTLYGRVNAGQNLGDESGRGFYYLLNGFYRKSDGYNSASEFDRAVNPYLVPSNVLEYSGSLKAGYALREGEFIEADFIAYDDRRGTGELVYQPYGNTTDHDTWQFRTRYSVVRDGFSADVSLFWLNEDYKKVNEYKKDDYTWYKVLSQRVDAGLLSSMTWKAGERHKISAGTDLKRGSVDAADVYHTSTDIVYNRGKMLSAGLFLQDELAILPEVLNLTAGIRYDVSQFRDGAFIIETPSAETDFMADIVDPTMATAIWGAASPRLALNYTPVVGTRFYLSAGRGFRPSVLDDLCRSGRIRGGFKLASPEAGPEYLTNYEAGADFPIAGNLRASVSAYYSRGREFLYYVNSGDSIEMGFGLRPVMVRKNIPLVEITGAEAEVNWPLTRSLILSGSYSYSYSVISKYHADGSGDTGDPMDLTGKHLTDVPSSTLSLAARWNNPILNCGLITKYQGDMWANDQNIYHEAIDADRYPAYFTVDLKFSRLFLEKISADLSIQNLFDTSFYDSKGGVCPGRFITFELGYRF